MLLKPPPAHIVTPDRDCLESFLVMLNVAAMQRHHPDAVVDVLRYHGLRRLIGAIQEALRCMKECGK